jgi:hypothetical protein
VKHVNWGRLLVGGLVAAVVILAIEFGFHWWVRGADWWFFRALADPVQEARAILLYAGRYTLVGITAIWLYVALRPRFGPRQKTAVLSGVAYWVIGYALPVWGLYHLIVPDYRAEFLRLPALVALIEVVLGTLAGASVYHRPAPAELITLRTGEQDK